MQFILPKFGLDVTTFLRKLQNRGHIQLYGDTGTESIHLNGFIWYYFG